MLHQLHAACAPKRNSNLLYAELAHLEPRLVDTGRLCPRSEDVCLCRCVVGRRYPLDLIEKAANLLVVHAISRVWIPLLWCRVHEIELILVC